MGHTRQPGRRILFVLIGGFGLLVVLLVGSALVGLQAVQQIEEASTRLVEEHRISSHLIDEAQRHEAGLSSIFYSIVQGANATERGRLLERLSALSAEFDKTTSAGMRTSEGDSWRRVQQASSAYVQEVREVLTGNSPPSNEFYKQHERLLDVMNQLVAANYQGQTQSEKQQTERSHDRVRQLLAMVGFAVLIAIAVAAVAVLSVQQIFRRLQWQASELARLSARMLETQEETARRFSRELHDEFGQTLSAIEANLVAIRNDSQWPSDRLEDAVALVKDAISNAREMSQLLRPSILDDFGLDASLRWFVERYSQRTGVRVQYESNFSSRLKDEVETHLFRIAQESLTNVSRHSSATRVRIDLMSDGANLLLTLADNGQGFDGREPRGGLGLPGMRTRAQSAGGRLSVIGKPGQGVTIKVEVPLELAAHAPAEDSYITS